MSFVDGLLEAEAKSKRGPVCGVGKLIEGRPDGAELVDALDLALSRSVKWSTLAAHLANAWDVKVSAASLSRHARKECSCGTE